MADIMALAAIQQVAAEQRRAVELLVQHSDFNVQERLEIITMHERWNPENGGYRSNTFLQFTPQGETSPQLFRTDRNVPAGAPAPDVVTQPRNFVRIT